MFSWFRFQIRQKIINKKESIEKSEKAKKQRTLKKYGKQVSSTKTNLEFICIKKYSTTTEMRGIEIIFRSKSEIIRQASKIT